MTRHARNCTAGAVYTYHEKKKDAHASGYGTSTQRIGKDSVKDFDCCCLTLQPCKDPVVTKDGFLFDKEAILQYIVTKKVEYAKKLKQYELEKKKAQAEQGELVSAEQDSKLKAFIQKEKNIVSKPINAFKTGEHVLFIGFVNNIITSKKVNSKPSVSNMVNGGDKHLPSFWVPSETPEAKKSKMEKPDKTVYCPMSGKPLKAKDLIDVKFTLVNDPDDKKSLIVKDNRYMCAVTHDVLSNSVPCAVIRTTGDVVTMECVERLIKKDWTHPLTGDKLTEQDIIPLQRGGTGYATTNQNLQGKHERPVLQA